MWSHRLCLPVLRAINSSFTVVELQCCEKPDRLDMHMLVHNCVTVLTSVTPSIYTSMWLYGPSILYQTPVYISDLLLLYTTSWPHHLARVCWVFLRLNVAAQKQQNSLPLVLRYRYNFMMWCFMFIYFLLIVQQFCSVILNKHYSLACCKFTVLFTPLDLTILNTSYRQVSDTSPEMKPPFRDKIWKTCQMHHHFSECLK